MLGLLRGGLGAFGLVLAVGSTGCFTDTPTPLRNCPAGGNTCRCGEDNACDAGLECQEDRFCRSPRCVDGTQDCPCIVGDTCNDGLECIDGSCLPPGDTMTSGATVPPPSNETSAGSTTSVSTTGMDSGEPDPTMPMPTTTPPTTATSGMGSSGGMSEVGEVGEEAEVGEVGGMPGDCSCGWLGSGQEGIWECAPGEPMPHPAGDSPGCPAWVDDATFMDAMSSTMVVPCDPKGVLALRGCCFGNAVIWCDSGQLAAYFCDDSHALCQ